MQLPIHWVMSNSHLPPQAQGWRSRCPSPGEMPKTSWSSWFRKCVWNTYLTSNIIQCIHLCCCLVTKSCLTLATTWTSARLLCPWDFPGKNTGVGCCFLLQGIFLTQGLIPSLLHWQVDSSPLSHQGSHLFVYLFAICRSSSGGKKCLFRSFAHFKIGLFGFCLFVFCYWVVGFLMHFGF